MSDKHDEEAARLLDSDNYPNCEGMVKGIAAALRAKDEQIENWRAAASRLASEKVGLIAQIDALKARL